MEGIVHDRTHEDVETEIGSHITALTVILHGFHASEEQAAFAHDVTAGFHEEAALVAGFLHPGRELFIHAPAHCPEVEALFRILVVGDAEAAAEVEHVKIPEHVFRELADEGQQEIHGAQVLLCLKELGADVLVYAGEPESVFPHKAEGLIAVLGGHGELGGLARGDDLCTVAGADTGVEADHDITAGVEASVHVELGKGVHADQEAVVNGIVHLVRRDVVGNVNDVL